ncbi:hypothetical protein M899_0177 [Bacteriovorax sp. BSW11_IV]|uniref:hypothetical protein n=1 Tax=Bacteriovorax sp. BSW11_IV TaxID=1353529 RepID=UPI00038A40E3|nr:hypothetical protein [Bacteriovorax sp. BSW11_IV]EQC47054.1 hypothetical protein M899_0177 [Bacteriovorax sp. BSW11_IV]
MKKQKGQALIEYLIIFGFLAVISVNMVKIISTSFGTYIGGLAYQLTQQLSVGACNRNCFHNGYINKRF